MAQTSHTAQEFSFLCDKELCFSVLVSFPWCSLFQPTSSCLRRILQCHTLEWTQQSECCGVISCKQPKQMDSIIFSYQRLINHSGGLPFPVIRIHWILTAAQFRDSVMTLGKNNKPTAPSGESASQQHRHTGIQIKTHNQHLIISRIYLQKKLIGH